MKYKYTTIDDLIRELEEMKKFHGSGDIPVTIGHASPIHLADMPYYYDGGYVVQDASDPKNHIRSKDYSTGLCTLREGLPKSFVDLRADWTSDDHSLDGRAVREIDPDSWIYLCHEEQKERQIFDGQIVKYTWDKEPTLEEDGGRCYYVSAYLESGEIAKASSMSAAKKQLEKLYKESKNESR